MGFCKPLGVCTVIEAELQAILLGLRTGYQMGFKKILIYSDSMEAVSIFMRDCCPDDHPLRDIIRDTRDLLLRDWDVKIHHTPRDNIACADYLAKEGHNAPADAGVVLIHTIPEGCLAMALKDQMGCRS